MPDTEAVPDGETKSPPFAHRGASPLRLFDEIVAGYRDEPHEISVKADGISSPLRNYYRYRVVLELLDELLGELGPKPVRIFDFGAYPGTFDRILKMIYGPRVEVTVAGLGFDEPFLDFCRRSGLRTFTLPDIDREDPPPLDLPAEPRWDVFLALNVLEHLLYPTHLFDLANRLLPSGGALVLTTDNISTLNGVVNLLRGESNAEHLLKSHLFFRGPHRPHMRIYSRREIEWLLRYSGFRLCRHRFFDCRAKQYRLRGLRIARRRRPAGTILAELVSSFVPHFRDHHAVIGRKAIELEEMVALRPAPTDSAERWMEIRKWKGVDDPRLGGSGG